MRTLSYIVASLAIASVVPGCSDDPGSLNQGPGGDPDGPTTLPPSTAPAPAPSHDPSFADKTLSRAREWIDAKMPYCGGPNGGHDLICGGTCERSGTAENTAWDDYRSDCSGFVSWSWGLPPPGRTTKTLAPNDMAVSVVISVDDLAAGDALNSSEHVMLFGGWVDHAKGTALVLQESHCGTTASEKIATFKKIDATTLQISDGRNFRTIRYKNRPAS